LRETEKGLESLPWKPPERLRVGKWEIPEEPPG